MKAYRFLHNPKMLNIWKRNIQRLGIVGEDNNIKTCITILGGYRLVPNAKPESGNLVIDGKSGGGKSTLVRLVIKSFLPNMVEAFSKITPKVLAYYEEVDWEGKILSLIDAENSVLNDPVVKMFLSGELQEILVTIRGEAVRFHITGKPAVVITAVNPELIPDLVRRLPTIKIDESPEQTARVQRKLLKDQKRGRIPEKGVPSYIPLAYTWLKPVNVVIPFADYIIERFPKEDIISRTTLSWLVGYISFHAAFHQYQRKMIEAATGGDLQVIKAAKADYEAGRAIINSMQLTLQTVPLTQAHRDLLEILKNGKPDIIKQKAVGGQIVTGFTTKELMNLTDTTKQNIGVILSRLHTGGLVERASKKGITRNVSIWWATKERGVFQLPEYRDLIQEKRL